MLSFDDLDYRPVKEEGTLYPPQVKQIAKKIEWFLLICVTYTLNAFNCLNMFETAIKFASLQRKKRAAQSC